MLKIEQNKIAVPFLFVFLFISYIAILQVVPADFNDIRCHATFAREMLTGERPYAGNFLVYLLVNIFSFFSTQVTPTEYILCFLLALATSYRFYLTQKKIALVLYTNQENNNRSYWFTAICSISLLFVFAIPIPSYYFDEFLYLGNYVSNVWHNSTVIF